MLKPKHDSVLIQVIPCDDTPGLIVDERDNRPVKGIIKEVGSDVSRELIGSVAYFRYYFSFRIPGTDPELIIIDIENVLATETKGE